MSQDVDMQAIARSIVDDLDLQVAVVVTVSKSGRLTVNAATSGEQVPRGVALMLGRISAAVWPTTQAVNKLPI